MNWLQRLFAAPPEPTCPGCGQTFVTWTEWVERDGYRTERVWTGCPTKKALVMSPGASGPEWDRHYAKWRTGEQKPLRNDA